MNAFNDDEEPAPQPLSNPPPTHDLFQPFDTLAYLIGELDAFAATTGFAVYKIRSTNHVNGLPTRVDFGCKRGKV